MKKTAVLLAAGAAVAAMIATPVFAQDTVKSRAGAQAKTSKAYHAKNQARMTRSDQRIARRGQVTGDWSRRGRGFWPASAAAGIAGGAVGTAGAIATGAVNTAGAIAAAPFGGYYNNAYYAGGGYPYGNSFASADMVGWNGGYASYNYNGTAYPNSANYDARNGFTCRPGTVVKLGGQNVLCQ